MWIPKSLSQREKVIFILENVGNRGVHSFDLIKMVSHKAPARLSELRKDGYKITSTPEKKGRSIGVRYILVK